MLECSHPLPDVAILAGRQGFLVAACAGKTVLHVGCVDAGLTEERLNRGELLHQRLGAVAQELWGTDVDVRGVRLLLEHGIDRVLPIDLAAGLSSTSELSAITFDVVVLGEVLEHLVNPGTMLAALRVLMRPGRTRLIVSVPNAFSLTSLASIARRTETVHPDHNFYFSRTTLRTLLAKCGLRVLEEYAYTFDPDRLPADRLRQTMFFGGEGRPERRPTPSSIRRLLGRLRHLPIREAPGEVAWTMLSLGLYRRTAYWADGLLTVCARDDDPSRRLEAGVAAVLDGPG